MQKLFPVLGVEYTGESTEVKGGRAVSQPGEKGRWAMDREDLLGERSGRVEGVEKESLAIVRVARRVKVQRGWKDGWEEGDGGWGVGGEGAEKRNRAGNCSSAEKVLKVKSRPSQYKKNNRKIIGYGLGWQSLACFLLNGLAATKAGSGQEQPVLNR